MQAVFQYSQCTKSLGTEGQAPYGRCRREPAHRVNVVGALDFATGELWYDLHPPSVNRSAVVNLIDRIAKRPQPMPLTIVVLDNASTHHHIDQAKLDEWLIQHRLLLLHLPPYSPELNLIESVWKHAIHIGGASGLGQKGSELKRPESFWTPLAIILKFVLRDYLCGRLPQGLAKAARRSDGCRTIH